jgi:hypothetical protein
LCPLLDSTSIPSYLSLFKVPYRAALPKFIDPFLISSSCGRSASTLLIPFTFSARSLNDITNTACADAIRRDLRLSRLRPPLLVMVLVFFPIITYLFALHTVMGAPANPLVSFTERSSSSNVGSIIQLLCNNLLKPWKNMDMCSKVLKGSVDPSKGVNTPYGAANGSYNNGVVRFAVKYATASRWQAPVGVKSWIMP